MANSSSQTIQSFSLSMFDERKGCYRFASVEAEAGWWRPICESVNLVYVLESASALLLAIGLVIGLTRIRRAKH